MLCKNVDSCFEVGLIRLMILYTQRRSDRRVECAINTGKLSKPIPKRMV